MHKTEKHVVTSFCLLLSLAALGSRAASKPPAQDAKPADYSKEPYVIEQISAKAVFENDGSYSLDTSLRVRIQSQAGLQAFGLLAFPYASATSTMEVAYVRVIKPDSRVVQTPSDNVLDMPSDITRQAPFYSDLKEQQVAVKGLEIGDTLEYLRREKVTKPLDPGQFWFDYNFFQGGIVLQEQLQISVPRDRYVKVQSPKLQPASEEQGPYRVYTWKTSHLESQPEAKDPKSPESDDPVFPAVQLTTFRTWDEVGQWFRSLAAPRAVPTPEIQAKASELTRDAKTDSEKTEAIYKYVSTKFRYIGISLGIGRYQPHAAADVLNNEYGDCKDKHTLFAALLAAAGVKAYPALINSNAKIDPDVPSPTQFDHVITAIPQGKGFLFLDTTPEVAPFGLLIAGLRDKQSLVIPEQGHAQLVQTPADPPFQSIFNFQVDGTLDDTGTLVSKMQMTLRDDAEVVYRLALRRTGQPQWKDVMQQISSNLGFGGTVSDVTATAPDATEIPFHIEYTYNRKEYSDWADKRISAPFPPIFLPVVPEKTESNAKSIELGSPEETLYRATMKLPSNSNPTLPPPVDLHESFADYHAAYSVTNGVMHFERRLVVKAREINPAQFEAYRKFHKAIEDDVERLTPLFGNDAASMETAGSPEAQAIFEQGRQALLARNTPVATDAFRRAVEKDPKYSQAWVTLGMVHIGSGDVEHGLDEVKKGIALDPTRTYLYKNVGSELMRLNRVDDALQIWKDFEKASPDDIDAPRNIASILSRQKHYPEALMELEALVKRKPDDASILLQLGGVYFQTGDKEKGVTVIQHAVAVSQSPLTLNDAAYALADNNVSLDNALHYSEEAVGKTEDASGKISLDNLSVNDIHLIPEMAAYWDTIGWVHFRMGHLDLAQRYLNAAWSMTQDAVVADHLGQVYEKQGKAHEAAVAYSRALAAGHAPDETKARLNAIRPGGKLQPGETVDPETLQSLRILRLDKFANKPSKHASAEFFILYAPGDKVVDVKFISGSDELRDAGKSLAAAKVDVPFPDDHPAQILRRGVLDCETVVTGCDFAFIPPSAVTSVK